MSGAPCPLPHGGSRSTAVCGIGEGIHGSRVQAEDRPPSGSFPLSPAPSRAWSHLIALSTWLGVPGLAGGRGPAQTPAPLGIRASGDPWLPP